MIDKPKSISSTPAKSTTKRKSGRITRKPDRYGVAMETKRDQTTHLDLDHEKEQLSLPIPEATADSNNKIESTIDVTEWETDIGSGSCGEGATGLRLIREAYKRANDEKTGLPHARDDNYDEVIQDQNSRERWYQNYMENEFLNS